MSVLSEIGTAFSLWIDTVARAAMVPFDRLKSVRRIEVVEDEDGGFTARDMRGGKSASEPLAAERIRVGDGAISESVPSEWAAALRGSRVDLVLHPSRFLFRPLELPTRASEFLEGIVRSQIDRLTPWNAGDAAYHWTAPIERGGERIAMTIVATARSGVVALAQAFADLGATSVDVSTVVPGAEPVRVAVYNQHVGGAADFRRARAALLGLFVLTGGAALISMLAGGIVAGQYDDQKQQIQRRISERRAVLRGGQSGAGDSALQLLARRKQTAPSAVMVIEALSALLPDNTYATELRIEGDKLQVVGITQDAPSLIAILEQSSQFTRATFFAPTTRAPNDPGERFHIEARIRPHFGSGT